MTVEASTTVSAVDDGIHLRVESFGDEFGVGGVLDDLVFIAHGADHQGRSRRSISARSVPLSGTRMPMVLRLPMNHLGTLLLAGTMKV